MPKTKVELIENFLVVWDPKEGTQLYKAGYFGKPLGIAKPKMPEFDAPLILDLMEGLYLLENKKIAIYEGSDETSVSLKKLKQKVKQLYDEFEEKYAVYRRPSKQRLNCNARHQIRLRLRRLQVRTRRRTCTLHGLREESRLRPFSHRNRQSRTLSNNRAKTLHHRRARFSGGKSAVPDF